MRIVDVNRIGRENRSFRKQFGANGRFRHGLVGAPASRTTEFPGSD